MLKCTSTLALAVRDVSRAATPIIAVPKINSYNVFVKENAKSVKINKENFAQVAKDASEKWKKLSPDAKQVYSKKSKEINEKALAAFNSKPKSEREKLEHEAREAKKQLAKKRELKERRDHWEKTGHPKMPANAFMHFVSDQYAKGTKPANTTEAAAKIKQFAEEWKTLDESKKAKYVSQYKASLEAYNKAVEAWKAKNH